MHYYVGASNEETVLLETDASGSAGSSVFYDIMLDEYVADVTTLEYREDASAQNTASTRAVSEYTVLPMCYMYIQRKAFGYNDDGTCSAVATGVALNYIAYQHGISHPGGIGRSENLTGDSGTDVATLYPNANALHRFLDDTCGMGPVSFGTAIRSGFGYYETVRAGNPVLNLSYTTSSIYSQIKSAINSGMPGLMTTASTDDGNYKYHTMCVYGARTNDGQQQFLVHTGWYGAPEIVGSGEVYYHDEIWVSANNAIYGYYFYFS